MPMKQGYFKFKSAKASTEKQTIELTSAWSFSIGIHSPGPQRSESTVATDDTTSFSSNCKSWWLSASLSTLDLASAFLSTKTGYVQHGKQIIMNLLNVRVHFLVFKQNTGRHAKKDNSNGNKEMVVGLDTPWERFILFSISHEMRRENKSRMEPLQTNYHLTERKNAGDGNNETTIPNKKWPYMHKTHFTKLMSWQFILLGIFRSLLLNMIGTFYLRSS